MRCIWAKLGQCFLHGKLGGKLGSWWQGVATVTEVHQTKSPAGHLHFAQECPQVPTRNGHLAKFLSVSGSGLHMLASDSSYRNCVQVTFKTRPTKWRKNFYCLTHVKAFFFANIVLHRLPVLFSMPSSDLGSIQGPRISMTNRLLVYPYSQWHI